MIRPVQTTRPRSGEHCCFCNGQGPQGRPQRSGHRPDNGRTPGPARCPRCGPRKSLNCAESLVRDRQPMRGTDARDPAWGGRPGRDRRAIESAGDQGGPMFGRCLIASRARFPSGGSSSFVVGSDRADHRCPRFRYPSRRSFAWRLPRWSTRPSTSGHVFEYRPVGAPTPRL